MPKEDKPIIFYHDSTKELAKRVAGWNNLETGKIQWKYYDDKWPNFRIEDLEKMKWRDIIFFAAFNEPADVFLQLCILYQFPEKKSGNLHVILPYYPVGTQDRADEEGEIITSQAMAQMLSATPLSFKGGRHLLTVFDIHAPQERSYFGEGNMIFDAQTTISLFLDQVREAGNLPYKCADGSLKGLLDLSDKEKIRAMKGVAVALPDEGAFKRFGHKLPEWLHVIKCDKVRDGRKRKIIIKEGNPNGKHVIILDDLVNSGGTQIECRHKLVESGAQKVSGFAPHGVFPKKAWKNITPELFDKFWITDSCPKTVEAVRDKEPFQILSLVPLISKLLE